MNTAIASNPFHSFDGLSLMSSEMSPRSKDFTLQLRKQRTLAIRGGVFTPINPDEFSKQINTRINKSSNQKNENIMRQTAKKQLLKLAQGTRKYNSKPQKSLDNQKIPTEVISDVAEVVIKIYQDTDQKVEEVVRHLSKVYNDKSSNKINPQTNICIQNVLKNNISIPLGILEPPPPKKEARIEKLIAELNEKFQIKIDPEKDPRLISQEEFANTFQNSKQLAKIKNCFIEYKKTGAHTPKLYIQRLENEAQTFQQIRDERRLIELQLKTANNGELKKRKVMKLPSVNSKQINLHSDLKSVYQSLNRSIETDQYFNMETRREYRPESKNMYITNINNYEHLTELNVFSQDLTEDSIFQNSSTPQPQVRASIRQRNSTVTPINQIIDQRSSLQTESRLSSKQERLTLKSILVNPSLFTANASFRSKTRNNSIRSQTVCQKNYKSFNTKTPSIHDQDIKELIAKYPRNKTPILDTFHQTNISTTMDIVSKATQLKISEPCLGLLKETELKLLAEKYRVDQSLLTAEYLQEVENSPSPSRLKYIYESRLAEDRDLQVMKTDESKAWQNHKYNPDPQMSELLRDYEQKFQKINEMRVQKKEMLRKIMQGANKLGEKAMKL